MASPADNARILYAGDLEIRLDENLVLAAGQMLALSVHEFGLLVALARRARATVTRSELYSEVWGNGVRPGERIVDTYVSKVRRKLAIAVPDRRFIHTDFGVGYAFKPQPSRVAVPTRAVHVGADRDG